MDTWTWRRFTKKNQGKRKTEALAVYLNPFPVCSLYKGKLVVCLFIDEETKESYMFAN
jgi:hypothetical protein